MNQEYSRNANAIITWAFNGLINIQTEHGLVKMPKRIIL
jgi:hypothetical protein